MPANVSFTRIDFTGSTVVGYGTIKVTTGTSYTPGGLVTDFTNDLLKTTTPPLLVIYAGSVGTSAIIYGWNPAPLPSQQRMKIFNAAFTELPGGAVPPEIVADTIYFQCIWQRL